jgi:hypothetical protein
MPLWGQDRALFEPEVWSSLPALLEDLLLRDLVCFAIVESLPSRVPRLLGGLSFIRPEYLAQGRAGPSTLLNVVIEAALRNRNPFLSPKEIGKENARGELHLLNLGNFDVIDLTNTDLTDFYRTSNEAHRFFLSGHSLRSMWSEVWALHNVSELRQCGMQIERQLPLANGKTATLLRLAREDAIANPYARFRPYFFPPKPRFAFSPGEQRLLEYALLDASDEEIAQELYLSKDGVKKRWRLIYAEVEKSEPDLLFDITSGVARRRTVLRYLRQHLEELRPYYEAPQRRKTGLKPPRGNVNRPGRIR